MSEQNDGAMLPTHVLAPLPRIRLPEVDPETEERVLDDIGLILDELLEQRCDDPGSECERTLPGHLEAMSVIIPLIESLLDDEADAAGPALIARLIMMTAWPSLPEQIILQIAFGRRVAEDSVLRWMRMIARATHRNLAVDEYITQPREAEAIPRDTLNRLFLGESRRTPDAERVQRGITLIRGVAAYAPRPLRGGMLCILGWLHWSRGQRPIALLYLDEALECHPELPLAQGLTALFHERERPAWMAHRTAEGRRA